MAKQVLLGSQSDIWYDAGICRAFQQYVTELFYFRRSWSYIQFGDDSPVVLERLDGFAPETVFPVGHGAGRRVDQYVRRQGEQPEAFFRFEPDELFELEWPLAAPVGSHTPYAAALRIGLAEDRLMERAPLAMRAQTEPDERLLPFVRARLGAYDDSIAEVRRVSARVRDSIFEPVTEPVTRFFEIDRVVRTQIAACEFRDYLIREFNRQVLGRWATANAWGLLELEWVPAQFSATDWRDVGQGFRDRELSYDDIVELLRVDRDATLRKNLSP
jgi:hypothetical protein